MGVINLKFNLKVAPDTNKGWGNGEMVCFF